MRNSLIQGLNATTRTANGMRANATTFSKNVDLFFAIGASRGKDLTALFTTAYNEDADTAVRILQHARDVRGGSGERQVFRTILRNLATSSKPELQKVASALLPKVPEIGRFDDLLEFMGTPLEADAALFIGEALANKNTFAGKWMPRKGEHAATLRRYWGLSPKEYRKLLVTLTNVVETKMCAKDWDAIEFGKLPSLASARYQKAFSRNAERAYSVYKAGLETGVEKVNAGAVFPYDVIKAARAGDEIVANAQWKALPNYMQDGGERLLAVADVSGSMGCKVGGNPNLTCMDVCISLSMYIAERATGPFKNAFLTFSTRPTLQVLTAKTLLQRYNELQRAAWDMSTNLMGLFDEVLSVAIRNNVPETEMPTTLVIFSDMQFDACIKGDNTALGGIRKRYDAAGYTLPKIVFWNLNATPGTAPATINDNGVALVSGCSPSTLKAILGGEDFSPEAIMMRAVRIPRYDWIAE